MMPMFVPGLVAVSLSLFLFSAGVLVAPSGVAMQSMKGRWRLEVQFANSESHVLRLDAGDSGNGTLLLLGDRAAQWGTEPLQATWRQDAASNAVVIEGPVAFPIGNVGVSRGLLRFRGRLTGADAMSGSVGFYADAGGRGDEPDKTGSFTAARVERARVAITAPTAREVRRGDEVAVNWEIKGVETVSHQQLLSSFDGGKTYSILVRDLEPSARSYRWNVPRRLRSSPRMLIKLIVVDREGREVTTTTAPIRLR